jgi:mannose-6-phosphate isomerase-like protein (cupin superfamily)
MKVGAADTGGTIAVLEASSSPGFGAPRHVHHSTDELFYVLDGQFEFLVGNRTFAATAGSFVFVPRGTVHAPRVVGTAPGRAVITYVPGGQEAAFDEFAAIAIANGGMLDATDPQMRAVAERHDSRILDPSA